MQSKNVATQNTKKFEGRVLNSHLSNKLEILSIILLKWKRLLLNIRDITIQQYEEWIIQVKMISYRNPSTIITNQIIFFRCN